MNEEYYMEFALKLAEIADGQTMPNPSVGSVIVKDGEIIGYGSHLKAGHAHAEINALQMAGNRAAGATMYVTLEPCGHFGKTPPCAAAIVKSGIERVVIASNDPNPLVAGKGIEMLESAGIQVITGILKEKADRLNQAFFTYIEKGRPFITLKQAITLDGKLAVSPNHGEVITGKRVQMDVHRDRERHDAILVGIGTVLADDPRLTNRYGITKKQPVRIILDTHLRIAPNQGVILDGSTPTWIFTGSEIAKEKIDPLSKPHVEIIQLSSPAISIAEVLTILAERKITKLYVEGGKTINASLLKSGMVDQVITYIAPKIIGGNEAVPMVDDLHVHRMSEAYKLRFKEIQMVGEDLKILSTLEER